MDILKAWSYLRTEPEDARRQVIPQAMHFLNKRLSSKTGGKALFPPRRLLVALSTRCDLRCKMCPLWGEEGLWSKKTPTYFQGELSGKTLKALADEIGPFRPAIILTGGEPLLTRHWYPFAKQCRQYGCRIFLATGGSFLEQHAEKVMEVIDHLQISLDGYTAKIHDRNRGREGSFQKVMAGIKRLSALKKARGTQPPFLNICHTITDENYLYLKEMLPFLADLNIAIHEVAFQHLEFTDKKTLRRHRKFYQRYFSRETNFWEGFLFHPNGNLHFPKLLQEIRTIQQSQKPNNIQRVVFRPELTLEEARVFYGSGHQIPERYDRKCLAPWQEAFIMPNGDVWTCPDYIAGNLLRSPFLTIWNNSAYRQLRQTLNRTATMPACKTCASLYVYQ